MLVRPVDYGGGDQKTKRIQSLSLWGIECKSDSTETKPTRAMYDEEKKKGEREREGEGEPASLDRDDGEREKKQSQQFQASARHLLNIHLGPFLP